MADAGVTFTWAPTQQRRALIVTLDYWDVKDHPEMPKKLGRVRVRNINKLWVEMLEGAEYSIQQLGVGYATDMKHATPNKDAVVEAWGNLQKDLKGQGVLVFIGHGDRDLGTGPLCLVLPVQKEYVCPEVDLHRKFSLNNDNEPLLSLMAICCYSGTPSPQPSSPESSLDMTFLDRPDGRQAGMVEAGPGPVGNQPCLRYPFDIDICIAPHDEEAKLSVAKAVTEAIHACWKGSNGNCSNEDVAAAVARVEGCSAPDVKFTTHDHATRRFLR